MKRSKQCPKCGGGEVVRVDGYVGAHGAGNNILLGSSIFSAVKLHHYICCSCGFVEQWLDKEDLEKVRNSKKVRRDF